MSLKSSVRHPVKSFKQWLVHRRLKTNAEQVRRELPLREFVYLDAVSLHSLLVSQTDTIPEAITQAISRADEAERIGTVGASVGSELIGKAESQVSARYQTSNSDSTQSSRKAVIQTLFKELRELPLDFRLVAPADSPEQFATFEEVAKAKPNIADRAVSFSRGTLLEVEVVLAVDPVFKLGAMMNEWSAMADDFPGMFANHGTLGFLRESAPIMKVLDRFLAGLIPIKATAVNYVVVTVAGVEYVAHKDAVAGLGIDAKPLRITGVTEHLGFWKDVRRVLFSEARFNMLCRVSRDGLHDKWTPVKLADLFSEVAPGFVDQINAVRSPTAADGPVGSAQAQGPVIADALVRYRDAIVPGTAICTDETNRAFVRLVAQISTGSTDAVAQREGFDLVREFAETHMGAQTPTPEDDLRARREARAAAGLELFPTPALSIAAPTPGPPEQTTDRTDERILDTEIIAIYW
ncbi:hypothetical protein HF995_11885 [Sanguibacter hominis ATCC BAA-789]|uniref:Uncharacterized protein n=1 Tax=Sanguibacter hominis ATCC BAA-789 TaxID=1312740 RepID=A0A9X5FCR9_9MICO|nr:hypothetical protein [Sanguibacter hominis]NKX93960.1 hypothetical protein [Sanguibacter hominis ATCC BAA-789]